MDLQYILSSTFSCCLLKGADFNASHAGEELNLISITASVLILLIVLKLCTDKQNALRRECTFKIEIVLEIGVAGVNIYLKITVLTLSDVRARLAQSVRPLRMVIDFHR